MEAALAGLAWTDTPQAALPLLLSQGGSDRARVAMYAATRCARFIPSAELGGTLEAAVAAADGKITSQKELIRLLGQLRDAWDAICPG